MKKYFQFSIIILIPILGFSQTNKNYINVGYSSICCGTASGKPIIDYVKKIEKKYNLKPFEFFLESGLGKEGEYNFYIGTDNLNSKQLNFFWKELKYIATKQNKERLSNSSGYVNVNNEFISKEVLKQIKNNPRTLHSSLELFDYKNINAF